MKQLIASISLLLLTAPAFAHPGRTDANGCHIGRAAFDNHCHKPPQASALSTVVSTGDGDTIRVSKEGKITTVRLGCIDAPEKAQNPWGKQSADRLKALLPKGKAVLVREIDRDRYGRIVGEVFVGNQSVNLQMVTEGQAVIYRQYFSGCASTQSQYEQAEAQAKQQKLGFWNQSNPQMPWDFRKSRR